eukprot:TRINITY_DN6898_c0_g1_i2.p3 TRINITY_DN6898_c0_g1~~TRINITY_DN6898_c0_g1_i2.p3  ORF type:complete len:186 (+),score=49.40 TRINITY_DN6898_c0_g1_i2:61-618(+)
MGCTSSSDKPTVGQFVARQHTGPPMPQQQHDLRHQPRQGPQYQQPPADMSPVDPAASAALHVQRDEQLTTLMRMFPDIEPGVIQAIVLEVSDDATQIQTLQQMQMAAKKDKPTSPTQRIAAVSPPAAPQPPKIPSFTVGQGVQALFADEWHPATITEVHGGDEYTVQWTADLTITRVRGPDVRAN